ncbi:hypothetical protein [Leifsonia sp. Leaf264]|uniref:hypothetical protein n=1 Tax=Leifsonia sp. Leaf264 TaxID=1736314 RepID=UPI0007010D1D|nr:hypothetical protein [Leifsonia sp. Leaf264]KQP01920.1 hypothetical protein ASF30_05035 [Leifsonia sp. Leaf264]
MSGITSAAGSVPAPASVPASVPPATTAPDGRSAWARHLWLWLSLIAVGIAIVFFALGFATSSLAQAASHSVQHLLGGDDQRGPGPGFDGRGDGTDGRSFPGRPGDRSDTGGGTQGGDAPTS